MASFCVVLFFAAMVCPVLMEGVSSVSSSDASVRAARTLHQRRCQKYGTCGGSQGGYGGYSGYNQGQQGYGQPPINIAISQSQSSANQGAGDFSTGYYPNNYQYNGGYPNHQGGYNGYNGYNGHNGYQGYQGYRPGHFGNGQGSYNNQFNGNYYGGGSNTGGYGFQRPFGPFFDENSESGDDHGYGNDGDKK